MFKILITTLQKGTAGLNVMVVEFDTQDAAADAVKAINAVIIQPGYSQTAVGLYQKEKKKNDT